ncbi:MAG TPA: hypothetical protein PKD85_22270 [Saprospiraceae bacterium]|nr:hypothetical protein [Saprospiraceae bacterium]
MKNPNVLIVHPNNEEQITILKAFLEALKIRFEFSQDVTYNPEFVAKILESKEQAKNGKVTRVKKENLKEFLGL